MKADLIKSENSYILKDGLNHVLGIDDKKLKDRLECPYLLSKQNCDEIFGVVDVEKLAKEDADLRFPNQGDEESWLARNSGVVWGFNKAMELNKDKVFTLEDMQKAINLAYISCGSGDTYQECEKFVFEQLQSLQQLTEIEVMVDMERISDGLDEMAQPQYTKVPKLDSEGCLILTKKI